MKTALNTLLVPTDFSDISTNAVHYAMELARHTGAGVILMHVYNVPVDLTDAALMPSLQDIGEACQDSLDKLRKALQDLYGDSIPLETLCLPGFVREEINRVAEERKADFIVMGTHGGGFLAEKIFGSTASGMMRSAGCPVLAIDGSVVFKEPKRILFACDYADIQQQYMVIAPLRRLASHFDAHIFVVNVVATKQEAPTVDEAVAGIKLEHALEDVNHTFHQYEHHDVVEGINGFAREYKIDMVVMIPHRHTLLEKLFQGSNTRRMAFHAELPVLTLHE